MTLMRPRTLHHAIFSRKLHILSWEGTSSVTSSSVNRVSPLPKRTALISAASPV